MLAPNRDGEQMGVAVAPGRESRPGTLGLPRDVDLRSLSHDLATSEGD